MGLTSRVSPLLEAEGSIASFFLLNELYTEQTGPELDEKKHNHF